MRSIRAGVVALLFGGLASVVAPVPSACAAAEGPQAALVVDTEQSGGQYRYCVALPDDSVSGLELIQLAHEQHGLDYRFGYGGNAVCVLAGVGYESDECLKDGPEFWGYWRADGSGGWTWSSSGANTTTVTDGDVEGWSWGTGNNGDSHSQPPRTTFASVCGGSDGAEGEPREPDGGGSREKRARPAGRDHKSSDRAEEQAGAGTDPSDRIDEPRRNKTKKKRRDEHRRSRRHRDDGRHSERVADFEATATAEASPPPSAADPSSSDAPPIGGIVATAAIGGFLAGGFVLQRRRRRVQ